MISLTAHTLSWPRAVPSWYFGHWECLQRHHLHRSWHCKRSGTHPPMSMQDNPDNACITSRGMQAVGLHTSARVPFIRRNRCSAGALIQVHSWEAAGTASPALADAVGRLCAAGGLMVAAAGRRAYADRPWLAAAWQACGGCMKPSYEDCLACWSRSSTVTSPVRNHAGNGGVNTSAVGVWPASFSGDPGLPCVMAVASSDTTDTLSSSSNYGPWVNIAAPGAASNQVRM